MSCSAYGSSSSGSNSKPIDRVKLNLPLSYESAINGKKFIFDSWQESDLLGLFEIFSDVIADGKSYPQKTSNLNEFRSYFLSHNCFVIKSSNDDGLICGGFYIKPNFPGRSSHIANYGVIVHKSFRGLGLANFLVGQCIRLARLLGYEALYTNLVYVNNVASIKICENYQFKQVGRLPKAGYLEGCGLIDAFQFYKDLTE